ncbi:MAG: beta-galactosidase [Candidatus Aminicenantes bacterium]|nr:beta-galactosidase [Candidatus Aminicenantes bacterium]
MINIFKNKHLGIPLFLEIFILLGVSLTYGILPEKSRGHFPVSVWYAGGQARAPMLEEVTPEKVKSWKKDLEQIKNLGFNTVRCWIEWTANEPEEGKYDFSALESLVDLADEVGLKVIIQVYIDSAPDWVGLKYPDAKFVASNGLAVESQASPGFCFDHLGVREKILKFFSEAAKVVKDKPAFYGWDLWSEPHIINWAEVYHLGNAEYLQFCYCHSTMSRFREWLKKKYHTLDNLNKAWYRTFQEWDDVEPPRFGTILTYTDYIDWNNFISDKLAEDLTLKAEAVRAVIPESVITSHSAIPGLFSKPRWNGTPDDRLMADSVDYYGVSIYPKHAWTIKPWSTFFRASGHDFARSMSIKNGGFYVGELQAGYGVFGMKLSVPVTGEDLCDWIWTAVAYGAKGINIYAYYPMSSGYESGGYGLVELDGKVTKRAVAAGKVAKLLTENMDFFLDAQPPKAEIAILYNPLSHMVGGQQQYTGERQPIGYNNLSESLQGVYRAFFERNMLVDFLHVIDLIPERLSQYKLLVVPYPVMMSKSHIKRLIEYVKGGGTLVAEARCGWNDERGFSSEVIPGGGLHEVFGCRESYLMPLEKTSTIRIITSHESLPFLKQGDTLDALFFEEGFELINDRSEVLAEFENGKPAIIYSSYGKGKAIIVGSFIGSAYHHFKNAHNAKFLVGLAKWLEIPKKINITTSNKDVFIDTRILEGKAFKVLFGFNRGDKKTEAKFAVSVKGQNYTVRNLESKKEVPLYFQNDKLIMEKVLEPGEIWIVVIKQK